MICFGYKARSCCCFKYCILDTFVDYWSYSISSKGFLPLKIDTMVTIVDVIVIEFNSPIPVHLSSLIPKMTMFSLGIYCLTTSNLPWFMDLTFQVPMQYYSLQHGLYFHHQAHPWLSLDPATLFLLELFVIAVHSSPVRYWTPFDLGSSSSSFISFCLFSLSMGFFRQEFWSGLTFPPHSGLHFLRTLQYDLSVLGGPAWHGS